MSKASKMASIFGKTEDRREEVREERRQEAERRREVVEWPSKSRRAEYPSK
jgi:hypothetical protein